VELCLRPETYYTPCATQAYHALTTVSADGNFLFPHIPAGRYYLSYGWAKTIGLPSSGSGKSGEFVVYPGAETRLGDMPGPN